MRFHENENLSSKVGTISNTQGFVYQDLNTGFSTKWSGYWSPPYKYLDYFSVKINGIWLDNSTLQAVDYGTDLTYYHETDTLKIKKIVKCPEDFPGFQILLEVENKTENVKAVQISKELGVDIRKRDQDISSQNYTIETSKEEIKIKKNDKELKISSEKDLKLKGDRSIKTHYPGEKQKCLIPGEIITRTEVNGKSKETVKFSLRTEKSPKKSFEKVKTDLSESEFSLMFNCSKHSLENLIYDTEQGKGIIAGHPWFQNYWARDTFWTLLGIIELGYFELSHEILENYADQEGFPTRILQKGNAENHGADSAPLFIIASEKLGRHYKVSRKIEEKQEEAFEKLETNDKGVVTHSPDGTWMDTLERAPAVDIQSLWLEAARLMSKKELEKKLKTGLDEFTEQIFMKDYLGENSPKTVNPTIPLMFNQVKEETAKTYLETINGEFSSLYGARTRSMADPGYESSGYHTGSVWGLTTGWAAAANLQYGKDKQGKNLLNKMNKFLNRNQLGALPEVVDAEKGYNIGCTEQAWSVGLAVHVIDNYILGIKVKNDKVVIDPSDVAEGTRFRKRVRDEYLDLDFTDNKVEVLNDPDINIEIKR